MCDPVHTADSVEYAGSAGMKEGCKPKALGPPSREAVHQCKAGHLLRVKANVGRADGRGRESEDSRRGGVHSCGPNAISNIINNTERHTKRL